MHVPRWIIALLIGVAVGLAGVATYQAHQLSLQVARDDQTQLANRVANVYSWCDGINEGRDYDRAKQAAKIKSVATTERALVVVAHRAGVPRSTQQFLLAYVQATEIANRDAPQILEQPYTLADEDCRALAAKTAASER